MTGVLRSAGFDAYSVAGGTSEWARTGRPGFVSAASAGGLSGYRPLARRARCFR
jgi:hypothetical protein